VNSNVEAGKLDDLSREDMTKIKEIYDEYIKESVHQLW
jgi:hypothetical protein